MRAPSVRTQPKFLFQPPFPPRPPARPEQLPVSRRRTDGDAGKLPTAPPDVAFTSSIWGDALQKRFKT